MHEDVFLDLEFNIKTGEFITTSNIKDELVEDFVGDFLHSQIGTGADKAIAVEKDIYHIHIGLDMSDDTFFVKSDTGNESLTTGIVGYYLANANKTTTRSPETDRAPSQANETPSKFDIVNT
jgi:hypothetical protein